jgi:hypothetical protein
LLFCACSSKEKHDLDIPDDIVSVDTMAVIMADIQLAEAEASVFPYSDTAGVVNLPAYYRYVLNKHKIDTATFGKNFRYYQEHPDAMDEVYTRVMEELSKRQADFNKKD